MKVAIMQPYFFPYIGYWQLIHAVDCFVLFDDVQYIRHGWINRNRILKPGGGWQYILVPLKKHKLTEPIKNVQVHPEKEWKNLIIRQLKHYKKKADYFSETNKMVKKLLFSTNENNIALLNKSIIKKLCDSLGLRKQIILSSQQEFDYSKINNAGDWALHIVEQMGGTEYINPIKGYGLFDLEKFLFHNIQLSFLSPHTIEYFQPSNFEPFLSIIDVLMFNGVEGTKKKLDQYSITTGQK